MLSTKLNVALSTATVNKTRCSFFFEKWCFAKLNVTHNYHTIESSCGGNLSRKNNRKSRGSSIKNADNLFIVPKTWKISSPSISSRRSFATVNYREKADVFGDLADKNYERTELDDDELKEEEFLMNEAKPSRNLVPSPGRYADMIKKHIQSGDLKAASNVLDQVKLDRNEPTYYMYNLLIRAFAVQGNLKKSFRLYNQMKKQNLTPTSATYVSLLNACANCSSTSISLEKLNYVRQLFIDKEIPLTAVHYNVMIKAYGRHGKLFEAFQLVDEMYDKNLTIGIRTLSFLLQGAISDKEAGFRHALVIWQLLRSRKLKPDIFTFNLLLRAARDCKLGKFKIEDLLILKKSGESDASIASSDRTNLLAHPPVFSPHMRLAVDSGNSEVEDASDDAVQSVAKYTEVTVDKSRDSEHKPAIDNRDEVESIVSLESSSPQTNLLLMGGFNNFTDQMRIDNVNPDIKTVTYLMELVPHTATAEKSVINYAKSMGIRLDADFYNLLIKKRSFRFDYDNALKVLQMMQQDNLVPNIMTWGVLALTCRNASQAREIFNGMELTGHRMNVQIVGAILGQASRRFLFGLVLELMEKMLLDGPKPNKKIYEILESFRKRAIEISKDKNSSDYVRQPPWQIGFRKFSLRYSSWVREMEDQETDQKKRRST